MKKKSRPQIALVIHNHQPVGNFDHVFEENFLKSYLPFLEVLKDFPEIRCHFHFSGPLIDYICKNHPDYFPGLKKLLDQGQVQILGGGYYEPVLALIPPEDRKGQLLRMNQKLFDLFGVTPDGCWLAERIWEDSIIPELSAAGIKYTLLDEEHFLVAGEKKPGDYYITDHFGKEFCLFPINRKLRYSVPWKKTSEVISEIEKLWPEHGLLVIADDGEKFGAWPGSYDHVYQKNWLRDFFTAVISSGIETVFLNEYMKSAPPVRQLYLPPSGYEAMNVWSLNIEDRWDYEYWQELLTDEKLKSHLQKGFFKNFLVRYPESNALHKKMLFMSRIADSEESRRLVYEAQCNCVYWHGMFGGIYLPVLREAAYTRLIMAQKNSGLKYPVSEHSDLNSDGIKEFFYSDGEANFLLTPQGGCISEWDLLSPAQNITDNFSRKPEIYHREAHDKLGESTFSYDFCERHLFTDHFLASDTIKNQFEKNRYGEQSDFCSTIFDTSVISDSCIEFQTVRHVVSEQGLHSVKLTKCFTFTSGVPECTVTIENQSGTEFEAWYGSEWNFSFQDYHKESELKNNISSLVLEGNGISLEIHFPEAGDYWGFPVNTVSRCHHNFELIRQCYSTMWHKKFILSPGIPLQLKFTFRRIR